MSTEQSNLQIKELMNMNPDEFTITEELNKDKKEKIIEMLDALCLLDETEVRKTVESLTVRDTIELLEIIGIEDGTTGKFIVVEESRNGESFVRRSVLKKEGEARYIVNISSKKSGGMGSVVSGFDLKVARSIAIKLISSKLLENDLKQEQLIKEARVHANSQHPNILRVYDFIFFEDLIKGNERLSGGGIVLEHMDPTKSPTIDAILQSNDFNGAELDGRAVFPPVEMQRFIEDMIDAIQYIGERRRKLVKDNDTGKVVLVEQPTSHYDIKPGNIFRTPEGKYILADFGLSPEVIPDEISFGTPNYISPEKAIGTGELVVSDLFSLTLNIYKMVTSEALPEGDTSVNIVLDILTGEARNRVLIDPEDPDSNPKVKALKKYCEKFNLNFNKVQSFFGKALHKSQDKRFQSINEYRNAALEAFNKE
ncbi:MAG: hypothetical protein GW941_00355 [Candidatus Pacebacteria bacterium]|nr:hypothetical protein [Candidatus Paceibacterota bacterium]